MKTYGIYAVLCLFLIDKTSNQCIDRRSMTYARWSGVSPDKGAPVFMYSASGDEESLVGACLARCHELDECSAVTVAYGKGHCHGIAYAVDTELKPDSDSAYFKKTCLHIPQECSSRWWSVESTPGYNLHTEESNLKVLLNVTIAECYEGMFNANSEQYRSAQWVSTANGLDSETSKDSEEAVGNCALNVEDKFTEPESYRVSNYNTYYLENQCRYDYPQKIDRCSYEEYYNQTLKHVEMTMKNYTKDECKTACELEDRFVCRGFTWTAHERTNSYGGRGLCDLHSEDLVTTGSWILRRTTGAIYYRRVICLNITVNCEDSNLLVVYRPRGSFRGRIYVPGRGDRCSARGIGGPVKLSLPLYGDCDVNFAYALTNGPNGIINRTMAYVMVMIQNNPIIQTAGDRWVRVGCSPGNRLPTNVAATLTVTDAGKPTIMSEASVASPEAASAVFSSGAPLTLYVVRAEPETSATAVALGEPLELRIETTDETEIEAYHLVASSRLGDSSVLLLDSRGCPTGQVDFPVFTRSWISGTQRLSAKFKAFRFPTSHVVRFALMVRYCDNKCAQVNCGATPQPRAAREANTSMTPAWDAEGVPGTVEAGWPGVVAQGGQIACGRGERGEGRVPLELEVLVGARDVLSADTLVRADHRATYEDLKLSDNAMVCVHELLLLALALAWLAVQMLLLLGCCVLVKRYRNLAELSMQKEYQSFDNVGFDTVSTHRRVHWPDQNIESILHVT